MPESDSLATGLITLPITKTMDSYDRRGGSYGMAAMSVLMVVEALRPTRFIGAQIFAGVIAVLMFAFAWKYRQGPQLTMDGELVVLRSFPYRTRRWQQADIARFEAVKGSLGIVPRMILRVVMKDGRWFHNDRFNCAPDAYPQDQLSLMCAELNEALAKPSVEVETR